MARNSYPNDFATVCLAGATLWFLCATPTLAVVGPSIEDASVAPYAVMVLQRSGTVAGFCTGVVIAPRVVLTAAHCVPPGAELRIHFKDEAGKPVLLPIAAAVRHPGYRADAIKTRQRSIDLALLRLPADLPPRFRPATLGRTTVTTAGTSFQVAGFGVARETDGTSSGVLRTATLQARAPLSSILLWAEDARQGGAGACTGDSGGPVLDASGAVVALTLWSAGSGKRQCGALTQALWLAPYRDWIAAASGL